MPAQRRESVANENRRKQSSADAPEMNMVRVAVLPPRLPPGMAPPSGLGAADAFAWEESLNWRHNEKVTENDLVAPEDRTKDKKGLLKKMGLTTKRTPRNPDLPPFTMREVTYDTWRKHYAKDADGNYHGTDTPAADCLLKPDDVRKWRLGDAKTKADLWTRGEEALPAYNYASSSAAPAYSEDYTGPPAGEPTLDNDYGAQTTNHDPAPARGKLIADGKTTEQIIAEHQAKGKPGWRQTLKRGVERGLLAG